MKIMSIKLSMAVHVEAKGKKTRPPPYKGTFDNIALALKETKETMDKADEMCQETIVEQRPALASQSTFRIIGEDDLFEAGKVEEAALVAAHSPKGVLRTMETLKKFKQYDATHSGSSVSVAYWEALLPTVAMGCDKPSEWETIECVKCVMEKGRVDLLTHWIAQDQLSLSEEVGGLIADACRCLDR